MKNKKLNQLKETHLEVINDILLDLPELLKLIADRMVKITGADAGIVLLLSDDGKNLISRESFGFPKGFTEIKIDEGIVGWVVTNREPCIVPDVHKNKNYV